jgi:hypothetical protein
MSRQARLAWAAGLALLAAGMWAQSSPKTPRAGAGSRPQLSFGLALDGSVYTVNRMPPVPSPPPVPTLTARLTLRNSAQPITLTFPSGQTYDFVIRTEAGAVVYRWSDGRAFTQVFRTETFGPGEQTYTIATPLSGADRNPLPQGKYVAEGWLTTQGGKTFDASAGFEIRWAQ